MLALDPEEELLNILKFQGQRLDHRIRDLARRASEQPSFGNVKG